MDLERGQCQRTDGKEWRCSRDVLVGQKYCERHVNRGRNRSRKPVGIPKDYIPGGRDDGGVHKPNTPIAAQPLTIVVGESHFDLSGPSPSSDILLPSQRMRKEKNKGLVRLKERNPNWTKEEDEALCKAWLRVSDDPATWMDQPRTRLWDRIWAEYNSILGCETERRSSGLLNRWSIIQSHLNKYSGFVRTIDKTPTNGYDIEESIGAAKQLYYRSEGHPFKWDGCWLLLKDTMKWFNYVEERESKRQKMAENKRGSFEVDLDQTADSPDPSASATTPCSNAGSVGLDNENSPFPEESHELPHSPGRELAQNKTVDSSDPSTPATTPGSNAGSVSLDDESTPLAKESRELPQPPGEKAVKNMRQLEAVQSFFAEFSKLRKEQKEIAEQEITMAKKREELKLQARKEEERRWVEAKLEPERMKITAKRDQGQMRLEKEIMMTDPNLVPTKEGKAWVIAQQKAILARMMQAGVGDGSRGSGV